MLKECLKALDRELDKFIDNRKPTFKTMGIETGLVIRLLALHLARSKKEKLELIKYNNLKSFKLNMNIIIETGKETINRKKQHSGILE